MNRESGGTFTEQLVLRSLDSLTDPSASAADKPEGLWDVKDDPIEERYEGDRNRRSAYPGQRVLQVLANASELQLDESEEVNARQ